MRAYIICGCNILIPVIYDKQKHAFVMEWTMKCQTCCKFKLPSTARIQAQAPSPIGTTSQTAATTSSDIPENPEF